MDESGPARKVVKEHVQGAAEDAAVPRMQECAPVSGPLKPRLSAASTVGQ